VIWGPADYIKKKDSLAIGQVIAPNIKVFQPKPLGLNHFFLKDSCLSMTCIYFLIFHFIGYRNVRLLFQ